MSSVYLDHAATTPIAPEVLTHFTALLQEGVANSSSSHRDGTRALALLQQARETVAAKLGCDPIEIIFTSGGTESSNWVLQRVLQDSAISFGARGIKPHFITSSIEHSSVAAVAEWLNKTGNFDWTELKAEADGTVAVRSLERAIKSNTVLVSVMHANNEIGTIQDLQSLGLVCRANDVLFHADACQSFCHTPFNVSELPVDFMSLSGHKIRAPKGVGAIYVRKGLELSPLMFGGKQERGLRPGTTSVELISAFAAATELWNESVVNSMLELREYAVSQIKKNFEGVRINGVDGEAASSVRGSSLCHVLSFTLPDVHSKDVHRALSLEGVACSTGAACGTEKSDSSAVLLGLGREPKDAHQIRISFSPTTDTRLIDVFIGRLMKVLKSLRTK